MDTGFVERAGAEVAEQSARVQVRPRRSEDLAVLLPILARTHAEQGYPVRALAVGDWWVASLPGPGEPVTELGGWVALAGERVVGHVALRVAAGPSLSVWTAGTGLPPERLAVVSRLFTDATAAGAGSALLDRSVAEARAGGRVAVLEVDETSAAYPWYRRRGWRDLGPVTQQWGHRTVRSAAMIAPADPPG